MAYTPTRILCLILCMSLTHCAAKPPAPAPRSPALSTSQLQRVGQRIWQNECAGTVAGLTSWNVGENFASLGIGHFIWYPSGQRGPFEESFPQLVQYFQACGVSLPSCCSGPCPWNDRSDFLSQADSPEQTKLRQVLADHVGLQTQFILRRLERALPTMRAQSGDPETLQQRHDALKSTPEGCFCLIDYVNFKGEGTKAEERYAGEGWGLLQVLETMTGNTPSHFASAAQSILSRRVANAPAQRGEKRWLAGWHSRCARYRQPL
jgi:hypothetical protein